MDTPSSVYTPVVTTAREVFPNQGVYKVEGVTVIVEPGATATLTIQSDDSFNYESPDVKEALQTSGAASIQFIATIDTDLC